LIPLAIAAAVGKRDKLQLYGTDYPTKDGTCVRDYIHVSDLATAHVLALKKITSSKNKESKIYNLGSEKGFTNQEVIKAVGRVLGKAVPVIEASRRMGDPAILVASSEKIRKELGWIPKYTKLEDIISSAWEWRKKHLNGYK